LAIPKVGNFKGGKRKTMLVLEKVANISADICRLPYSLSGSYSLLTMPPGTRLANKEKGAILVLQNQCFSLQKISAEIGRPRNTMKRFLARPHPSQQGHWKPRNKKLTDAAVRRIVREACKTKKVLVR